MTGFTPFQYGIGGKWLHLPKAASALGITIPRAVLLQGSKVTR